MRGAVQLFGILCLASFGIWLCLPKQPPAPVYKGIALSEWLRDTGVPSHGEEEAQEALNAIGINAIPWLVWAAEHGHRPEERSQGMLAQATWVNSLRSLFGMPPVPMPDSYDERRRALWALRIVGKDDPRSIDVLRRLCGDPELGMMAAKILAKTSPSQRKFLIQLSANGSANGRKNAIEAFEDMSHVLDDIERQTIRAETLPPTIRALQDEDWQVRAAAARAYGLSANYSKRADTYSNTLPILIDLLADPAWEVKSAAGGALSTMGKSGAPAIPKLLNTLSDPHPWTRICTAWALGDVDREKHQSKDVLLKMTSEDPDPGCRVAAAQALGKFGLRADGLIDTLIIQLEDTAPTKRGEAMCSLVEIGPMAAKAMPAILNAMEKPAGSPANYSVLISKFYKFGVPACIPYVLQALMHPNPIVRESAAALFEDHLTNQKSLEIELALTKATQDSEQRVRVAAEKALNQRRRNR